MHLHRFFGVFIDRTPMSAIFGVRRGGELT
jgi:hypothetical protein